MTFDDYEKELKWIQSKRNFEAGLRCACIMYAIARLAKVRRLTLHERFVWDCFLAEHRFIFSQKFIQN